MCGKAYPSGAGQVALVASPPRPATAAERGPCYRAPRASVPLTRYLLLRNSSLGDVVFALAAVDRLREHDPGAEIAFLVDDRFAAVAAAHPGIDEVLTCPRTSGVGAMLAFRRRLAQRRFDVAVDLQGNAKSAFLLTALRGARTIGFARGASRNLSHLFTGECVKPPESARHRVDRFLSLLTPLGAGARPSTT